MEDVRFCDPLLHKKEVKKPDFNLTSLALLEPEKEKWLSLCLPQPIDSPNDNVNADFNSITSMQISSSSTVQGSCHDNMCPLRLNLDYDNMKLSYHTSSIEDFDLDSDKELDEYAMRWWRWRRWRRWEDNEWISLRPCWEEPFESDSMESASTSGRGLFIKRKRSTLRLDLSDFIPKNRLDLNIEASSGEDFNPVNEFLAQEQNLDLNDLIPKNALDLNIKASSGEDSNPVNEFLAQEQNQEHEPLKKKQRRKEWVDTHSESRFNEYEQRLKEAQLEHQTQKEVSETTTLINEKLIRLETIDDPYKALPPTFPSTNGSATSDDAIREQVRALNHEPQGQSNTIQKLQEKVEENEMLKGELKKMKALHVTMESRARKKKKYLKMRKSLRKMNQMMKHFFKKMAPSSSSLPSGPLPLTEEESSSSYSYSSSSSSSSDSNDAKYD